jgi:recombination protein RecA
VAKPLDTRKDSARSGGESRQQESKSAHAVGGHQSSGATPHSSSSPAVERDPARDSALARAMQQIEKQYGKGAVMRMDGQNIQPIEGIETGSLGLDIALGGVGVPRGRVLEIFGPESSGKTTLTLHIVANAQKNGGVAAFIDAEHALDPSWCKRLGVKLEDLLVSQPDTGEQALEICEMLVRSNAVDVIVIDSVAALIPRAEIEGEMGDTHVGLQARLMSQALRKLTGAIARSKSTVIFINQIREKIGVMFGSPETTPGGRALKFYSSVRIDVRRISTIKEQEVSVGCRTRARVVKNKIAPPFREAEFDIMFDRGISYEGDVIDLAVVANVVEKSGAWYNYGSTRLGQGRESAKQFLADHREIAEEIRNAVLKSKGLLGGKMAAQDGGAEGDSKAVAAEGKASAGDIKAPPANPGKAAAGNVKAPAAPTPVGAMS